MKITVIPTGPTPIRSFGVLSDSGENYRVDEIVRDETRPEEIKGWACTCTAGIFCRPCRHVKAVAAMDKANKEAACPSKP